MSNAALSSSVLSGSTPSFTERSSHAVANVVSSGIINVATTRFTWTSNVVADVSAVPGYAGTPHSPGAKHAPRCHGNGVWQPGGRGGRTGGRTLPPGLPVPHGPLYFSETD